MTPSLQWLSKNAQQRNQSSCWVCEQLPISSSLGSGHGGYHCSRKGDWKAQQYIQEEQATTRTQFKLIYQHLIQKTWLVACTINNTVFFSANQIQAVHQTSDQKDPRNPTTRAMGGYAQIWNGFMGFTPECGHLNPPGTPVLETGKSREPARLYQEYMRGIFAKDSD